MGGVNPYCACGHMTRNHFEGDGFCGEQGCECKKFNNAQNPLPVAKVSEPESRMVQHARSELARLGNDPEFNDPVIEMIKIFAGAGHSGGSAPMAIDIIHRLLKQENLSPLTDDPDEWEYHNSEVWGAEGGVWQNKRDGRAFSTDHGFTYWRVSDTGRNTYPSVETPEGAIARKQRALNDK